MARRPELFSPDRGLQARMIIALFAWVVVVVLGAPVGVALLPGTTSTVSVGYSWWWVS